MMDQIFKKIGIRNPNSVLCVVIGALGLCVLYIPIFTLIIYSFVEDAEMNQWGLGSYTKLFLNEKLLNSINTSILIGVMSSTVSMVLGGVAAIGLDRVRPNLRGFIRILTYAPLILPEIVFGLGLLLWFVFLRVSLGSTSLVLAHVTFSVSYVLLTVLGRVQTIDSSIADAARDLGASSRQIFWKVQLPLLTPALISGWMMAFTLSFDDFLISFFTSGPDTVTLPLALYSSIKYGLSAEIFAMASCIFAVSFVGAMIVTKISGAKQFE